MSAAHPYLDQFLDSLENLSPELTRNFKLIHELDSRIQNILVEIDSLKADYFTNSKSLDADARLAQIKLIDRKHEKVNQLSEEKVQLANQAYEMVDKHIRKLDTDLAHFEAELKERSARKSGEHAADGHHIETGLSSASLAANNLSLNASTTEKGSKNKKKKVEQPAVIIEESKPVMPISSLALTLAQPADVLDMPVDPNEPTYCTCKQVSYGEMIACDNEDCAIEWFHFGCVGLTSKPKGKWFCPVCSEKRKKT